MSETLDILPPPTVAKRLDRRLASLRTAMRGRWLELGELLVEIQESLAYRTLGFKNFQSYLAERLEVSPRWAMYLIKLVRKMHDFEIDRKDLVRLDISKCLEIFRLDDAPMVRELVEQAHVAKLTLSDIRQTVQRALGIRPISSDEVVKKLWAFPLDQWLVVERAIEHVQRGGPVSDTRALELICADFLAGVQHEALQQQVC
jgi:hypothetical protein